MPCAPAEEWIVLFSLNVDNSLYKSCTYYIAVVCLHAHTPPSHPFPTHRRSTVLVAQRTLTLPLHSLVHRRGSHLGDTVAGEWTACWNPRGTRDPLPFEERGMEDAIPREEYTDFII